MVTLVSPQAVGRMGITVLLIRAQRGAPRVAFTTAAGSYCVLSGVRTSHARSPLAPQRMENREFRVYRGGLTGDSLGAQTHLCTNRESASSNSPSQLSAILRDNKSPDGSHHQGPVHHSRPLKFVAWTSGSSSSIALPRLNRTHSLVQILDPFLKHTCSYGITTMARLACVRPSNRKST